MDATDSLFVLLIDDSDADLLFTQLMLERSGAVARVQAFETARAALAWLALPEAQGVDLILLDINMPGMNGFEFLQAYEASPLELHSPSVVMLTSSPDPDDQRRAAAFRTVRGYVTKPIDVATARSLVRFARP